MPAYCTPADVRAALTPGGVADDDQTAASLADDQLRDAIAEAQTIVDAYIQGYSINLIDYAVTDPDNAGNVAPYSAAPDPIRRWTRDVAAYLAALTFRKNRDLSADDPIRLRFAIVMGLLNDVRNNTITIPLPPVDGESTDGVEIYNLYEGTLFGPEDFNLTSATADVHRIWRAETAVQ